MKVLQIPNHLDDFKNAIINLQNVVGEKLAFISYIEGEFGYRVLHYSSNVKEFAMKQRELGHFILAVCFKGNTFYLQDCCDLCIEIQGKVFSHIKPATTNHFANINPEVPYLEGSVTTLAHPFEVPTSFYAGENGFDLHYLRGTHDTEYEAYINSCNFKNCIYTLRPDGLGIVTPHSVTLNSPRSLFTAGKLQGQPFNCPTDFKELSSKLLVYNPPKPRKTVEMKNNKIAIWVRMTNKDPQRNFSVIVLDALFDYCIANKIYLYIFLDLIPIPVRESEYIIVCNREEHTWDAFVKICSECYLYIGCSSGTSEMVYAYTDTHLLLYSGPTAMIELQPMYSVFRTKEDLLGILDHYYPEKKSYINAY